MAPDSTLSCDAGARQPQLDPALPLSDRTRRVDGPPLSHEVYTVAWICALSLELTASRAMLDAVHEDLVAQRGDDNVYILGRIAHHNVVMVALPSAYGKVNAATVSTNLKRNFPNIAVTLMVGIGGGAPGEANMRLGDVVVATRVVEYDLGKALGDGQFESTEGPKRPSQLLLSAVTALRSKHGQSPISPRMLHLLQTRLADHQRPTQPDRLFRAIFVHPFGAPTCENCSRDWLQLRSVRASTEPWIHYGGIASGDSVNKDAQKRDVISRRVNAICFEMEAAGIMDNLYCLPIRGICDYSDSHKNDHWQPYAAATAAAYARELLETIRLPESSSAIPSAATHSAGSPEAWLLDQEAIKKARVTLINSLDFSQLGARKATIRAPQKKTCLWFLDHPVYLDWLDQDKQESHHGFLWIRGKAGAGKSILMNFLYSEARSTYDDSSVASYFYNARGEYLEKSTTGMYRSLLKHLLTHMPNPKWEKMMRDMGMSFFSQTTCPGFNQLKDLLRSAVLGLDRPLLCFIDALDECDEDDVRDMVSFFEDLAEEATEQNGHLRVCFSSRPYPYISIRRGLLVALEEETGHTSDLTQYVNKRLKVQAQYHNELRRHILDKASGIFMWVVLVVDILNKENNRGGLALRRRLSEIPLGLSRLFKAILLRDQDNPQDLQRCIMWILCARRPLRPDEFRHAMWVAGLEDGRVDNELPSGSDPESSNMLVISSSKGLAEVTTSERPVVQFIHESVRDFLVRDRGLQEIWPDLGFEWEGPSHENIRKCCELYLSRASKCRSSNLLPVGHVASYSLDERVPFTEQATTSEDLHKRHAFLGYAEEEILYHSNLAAPYLPQEAFLARLFGFESKSAIDYGKVLRVPRSIYSGPKPGASILEVFAQRGLGNLVQLAVDTMPAGPTHRQMSETYRSAFFAAIHHQHMYPSWDAVPPLLGLTSLVYEGEKIDTTTRRGETGYNRTPLSWASQEGHHVLAKILIQKGESMHERDSKGDTPLSIATTNQQVSVIRLLIDSGLDMNTDAVGSLIYSALEKGYYRSALVLLEHYERYATLSGDPARFESTWISQYAGRAPLEIVDLLIGHVSVGTDIEPRLRSPLRLAVISGNIERVECLIDRGADVNARDQEGGTPLMTAVTRARSRKPAMVRLLTQRGADVGARNKMGRTTRDYARQLRRDASLIEILGEADSEQGPWAPWPRQTNR